MKQQIERIVLENLSSNETYARNVLPHIEKDYFQDPVEQQVFEFIKVFFLKHNKLPNKKIFGLFIEKHSKFNEEEVHSAHEMVDAFDPEPESNVEWLMEETEKFCKDRAIFNALSLAIDIQDGNNKEFTQEAIPSILSKALSVCFDKNVGHDYVRDAEHRWEYYHKLEKKVPFPIEIFNKITNGGASSKTLNLYMMPPKTGKTLAMCDHAAFALRNGFNVLYITLEMAEERIAERIDANMFDMEMKKVKALSKDAFLSKFKQNYEGRLKIKEYPTCGGHVGHFKALLDELKLKDDFVPDIIFIDYLNICASQRLKMGAGVNSYSYIKAIGEELRGLAVEYDVPIISATQTNRGGANNTDLEVDDLSDSFGTAMTVDFMIAGMRTPEMDELGQMMFKQILSRYNDVNYYRKFVVGVDLPKFKMYDVDDKHQNLNDAGTKDSDDVGFVKDAASVKPKVELDWD